MAIRDLTKCGATLSDARRQTAMTAMKSLGGLIVLTMLWALANPALAQEDVIKAGQQLFKRKCAVCHGLGAKGDGDLAKHLKVTPADLTRITERNAGIFPFWLIYGKIDGREDVSGHGPREMPVWGTTEPSDIAKSTGHLSRGQMLELVFYIESVQVD